MTSLKLSTKFSVIKHFFESLSLLNVQNKIPRNVNCFRESTSLEPELMAPKRYFVNTLPDYKDGPVRINFEGWKRIILEMALDCEQKQAVTTENVDGGLYVGTAGIAYMYYHLSNSPAFTNERETLLRRGLAIVKSTEEVDAKVRRRSPSDICSFILGQAGLNAISAALHHAVGDVETTKDRLEKYIMSHNYCKDIDCFSFGGDELFVGRAGYICGALWLRKVFGRDIVSNMDIVELCNTIVKSGQRTKGHGPTPLCYSYYGTAYLGAAHGISTILQMIISTPSFLMQVSHSERKDIENSIDGLLSLQTANGSFPCSADEVQTSSRLSDDELVHWCHGAPGIVYLMAKAYLNTNNRKYLESCIKCGDITWEKGLLRKGPGICHGIAGSGYVFLLLYRLTDDPKYLHRAHEFAKFLQSSTFKEGARIPDRPYSLYEGNAGTVCFLADLLNPKEAAFPFLDVF